MKTNDADLIRHVLDGDQGAFTTLVDKYQKSVHALVWRKIGDFHIAEEITQDVFLKVYKRLSTLKRPELFPGWLYVREIAKIRPASPSVSKPWLPWGLSLASTVLVILMMGAGPRALSRFQQPYSLDATSEMTIELVDAPIVFELKREPDALTRFGSADTPSKNRGSGFQAESLLVAAAHAEETDLPAAKPQWIQTKGPGGTSRAGLFLASDRTLYGIAKTGLYRLTEAADTWTLVSASGPNREFNTVMAERNDTLYLPTSNELLASVDDGRTWNSLGARPEGRVRALIVTDTAIYLVLQTEVFRSEDVGNQWHPIGKGLRTDNLPEGVNPNFRIWDALAVDNTLFVGTSQGLFRFTDDWKKLPIPIQHGIFSLANTEDRLYVGTITGPTSGPHAAVFYSTDLGDFWTDITPDTHEHPVKLIAAVQVVPIEDALMLIGSSGVLRSDDGGETWMNPGGDRSAYGAFPTIALDENNLYKSYHAGIRRSTDGGVTWQPFMTGMVNSDVPSLVALENVLYALTPEETLKSADGGESWEAIGLINANEKASLQGTQAQVATANGMLYASNSGLDEVTLYRLSEADDVFLPVEGIPNFEEDTLYKEWWNKRMEARKNGEDVNKVEAQRKANEPLIIEEWMTNGTFTIADDTVFMEYRHKLYRWRRGETAWHDTGLEDIKGISPIEGKGLTLAASGNTVYAGKREGALFLSQDSGDTWSDVTANLVFPFGYFKEILFAESTVYVSTDMGVMSSRDGETWHVLTDVNGKRLIMDRIAVNGALAYGVCDSGVYQVDTQTNTWKQIVSELPHTATSFAIDGDTFYIGTKQNGVFRFQRNHQ